jgi:uncharacterized protein YndB with AHSA1/START domain
MKTRCPPDVSSRPHSIELEQALRANAHDIYEAWTERFDRWFAEPGDLMMTPEVDVPYFFLNRRDWGSHPHYGRFVELVPDELVVMTWLTGAGGTEGAETLLRIELTPQENGTLLKMVHSGFPNQASADGHADNWPEGLEELDDALAPQAS